MPSPWFDIARLAYGPPPFVMTTCRHDVGGGTWGPSAVVWTAEQYDAVLAQAAQHTDASTYLTLGKPTETWLAQDPAMRYKPGKSSVSGAWAIFVDLDDASGVHGVTGGLQQPTAAEIDDVLAPLFRLLPPTLMQATGGGRQAVWRLDTFLDARTHRAVSQVLSKAVVAALAARGWKCDHLYETERETRAPGSRNAKPYVRTRDGHPFPVSPVAPTSGRAYTVDEVFTAFEQAGLCGWWGAGLWPEMRRTYTETPAQHAFNKRRSNLDALMQVAGFRKRSGGDRLTKWQHPSGSPSNPRHAVTYYDVEPRPDAPGGHMVMAYSDSAKAAIGGRNGASAFALFAHVCCAGDWRLAAEIVERHGAGALGRCIADAQAALAGRTTPDDARARVGAVVELDTDLLSAWS